jgi:putative chitinase
VQIITLSILTAAGASRANAGRWLLPLREVATAYAINTPARVAAWLAQVGHESLGLAHTVELWGPTAAQARYEGRKDLGNLHPGDGFRFRGHGLIQITGRANHAQVRDRLRARLGPQVPDFEAAPTQLALAPWAAWCAGDYWDSRSINPLADAGAFEAITRAINGGLTGHADRLARWGAVRQALATQLKAQP